MRRPREPKTQLVVWKLYYDEFARVRAGVFKWANYTGLRAEQGVAGLPNTGLQRTLPSLAARLRRKLHFLGENVVAWDRYGYGYDHT